MNNPPSIFVRASIALLMIASLLPAEEINAQTTALQRIQVTAPTTSGGSVICQGQACADMLRYMQETIALNRPGMPMDAGVSEIPVDKGKFCTELKNARPAGCGVVAPYAAGINIALGAYASQHANGCGDGSWTAWIASQLGSIALGRYSGNPDSPWEGVPISFRSACNAHDACYSAAGLRSACDNGFRSNMVNACDASFVQGSESSNVCYGFADAYSYAVRNHGDEAYSAAASVNACALWHKNMDVNGCSK